MAEASICPRCGMTIPADAPEGLCPRCLADLAVRESKGEEEDDEEEPAGTAPSR